jgi:hypothetical protein
MRQAQQAFIYVVCANNNFLARETTIQLILPYGANHGIKDA